MTDRQTDKRTDGRYRLLYLLGALINCSNDLSLYGHLKSASQPAAVRGCHGHRCRATPLHAAKANVRHVLRSYMQSELIRNQQRPLAPIRRQGRAHLHVHNSRVHVLTKLLDDSVGDCDGSGEIRCQLSFASLRDR